MTAGELIDIMLTVEFAFGATSALAFQKQIRSLYQSIFDKADESIENKDI